MGIEPSSAVADILREIVAHHSVVYIWHDHHPDDDSTFTFVWVEEQQLSHSWLDCVYFSRCHLLQAHSFSVWLAPFLEHHLVAMTASVSSERPRPAYWHFNNSLLQDAGFVASFWEFYLVWQEQRRTFPSVRWWWDVGKVRARLFCCSHTRGTSRQRVVVIEQLEWEVLELERHLATSPGNPPLCGASWEKREELRALDDLWARGAFVRSCIHFLRDMDCGSHFFYTLEKKRGAKKHDLCLLAEDGTPPPTYLVVMCKRARAFYAGLFSPDPTDADACGVLWDGLPTVSMGDWDWLELPLTLAKFS
ncbi:unnamed protein product [Caretta caretta]